MWDDFEQVFLEDWANINELYWAMADLDTLHMKNDDIDTYITWFTKLAHKVLYQENNLTVLKIFKRGLLFWLLTICINYDESDMWKIWKIVACKQ